MKPHTLVISGGGTRCLIFADLLCRLESAGTLEKVEHLWGTSAGALLAAMYALTRSGARVKELLWSFDFSSFRDVELTNILNIMNTWGMDDGTQLVRSLTMLLNACCSGGSEKKLRDIPNLNICIADLTLHDTIVANSNTFPELRVVDALRATMSLPMLLRPFRAPNGHFWIDGGVRANFPFHLVPDQDGTLGLGFVRPSLSGPTSFGEYIFSMIHFDEPRRNYFYHSSRDKRFLMVPTPPFPAWFVRLRPEDYTLVEELAKGAFEEWQRREPKLAGAEGPPQGTTGTLTPSAPLCIHLSSCPAHHTAESSGSPPASQGPSQGSSPHSRPRTQRISRRWSL
jgi:predicted acylesterase/phospholipase RssA